MPEYVGFWRRVVASLVDTVWTAPLLALAMVAIYGVRYLTLEGMLEGGADLTQQVVSLALLGVVILPFWFLRFATPGKMLVGAKIVDARTGDAPSRRQLIVRYVGYFVSMLPLCLGFAWVGVDRRKQGWHDKLAGTVVVSTRPRKPEVPGS